MPQLLYRWLTAAALLLPGTAIAADEIEFKFALVPLPRLLCRLRFWRKVIKNAEEAESFIIISLFLGPLPTPRARLSS